MDIQMHTFFESTELRASVIRGRDRLRRCSRTSIVLSSGLLTVSGNAPKERDASCRINIEIIVGLDDGYLVADRLGAVQIIWPLKHPI